jgi:hypothetical protein
MQLGRMLLAVGFTLAALVCVIWWGRYEGELPAASSKNKPSEIDLPKAAASGPHPRAVVVDSADHNFGVKQRGTSGEHTFVIQNEGEAPLELVTRPQDSTCQCTVGKLGDDGRAVVAPGESIDILLNWEMKSVSAEFRHSATIHTNDPENQSIRLTIEGKVEEILNLNPEYQWDFGEMAEGKPGEISGTLHSGILDDFEILAVESANSALTGEAVRIEDPEELEMLGAKSAYSITARLDADIPVGRFRDQFVIRTNHGEVSDIKVEVAATRLGPFQILPSLGVEWYQEYMLLRLGTFSAVEGKTVTLPMFIRDADVDLEISSIESDPTFLNLTIEPDTKFTGKRGKRYHLTFEIPPGSPTISRTQKNAGKITVGTNIPGAETMVIRVDFIAI